MPLIFLLAPRLPTCPHLPTCPSPSYSPLTFLLTPSALARPTHTRQVWASDADTGWGAWSVETGWTQSWITTLLGLRELKTNVWELAHKMPSIRADFNQWVPLLFPGHPLPA